jgi:signal transduction histidine kinase
VALLAVLIGAVGFASSDQAVRVSQDALLVRHAERALSDSATMRSNVGIMVVLASAQFEGLDVSEQPATARDAAVAGLERLRRDIGLLPADGSIDLGPLADEVGSALDGVVDSLRNPEVADRKARGELLPALDSLDSAVAQLADAAAGRIELESGSAGRAAFISSLMVGLLIPAIAVGLVRSVARRRGDHELLVAELRAERELAGARDEMIAGLSHELRTPLTGIFGFSEALRDLNESGELDREFLAEASETIYREAGELRRMIDDLLVAARVGVGGLEYRFEDVDVAAQVGSALEPFVKRGDQVAVSVDQAAVRTDRFRLQHAVRNVVANAIDHGGVDVRVDGRVAGSVYLLAVSDAGDGVPAEIEDRIFERFLNRASVTSGTSLGMGLAVAQALMTGMGGFIEYRRLDGRTVFTFEIPLSPWAANQGGRLAVVEPASPGA